MQAYLSEQGAEIAHLKMTLSPDAGLGGDVAIINLVRNDFVPELSADLDAPIESGQLIINLRAEGDPETLRAAVETALATAPAELAAPVQPLQPLQPLLPAQPLQAALEKAGLNGTPEDAARIEGDPPLLQSVDGFPALVSDPWLNGRLTTLHA